MVGETTRKTNQIIQGAFNGTLGKTVTIFVPFEVTQAARGAKFDSSHAHKGHEKVDDAQILLANRAPTYERNTHATNTKTST